MAITGYRFLGLKLKKKKHNVLLLNIAKIGLVGWLVGWLVFFSKFYFHFHENNIV